MGSRGFNASLRTSQDGTEKINKDHETSQEAKKSQGNLIPQQSDQLELEAEQSQEEQEARIIDETEDNPDQFVDI